MAGIAPTTMLPALRSREEPFVTVGMPVRQTVGGVPFSIGAWNAAGEELVEARFDRGGRAQIVTPERQEARVEVAGSFIFGGMLQGHYGHFLLETLARAWALIRSAKPIVWLSNDKVTRLRPFHREAFEALGIDPARHVIIHEPTRFERLEVPEPGAILWRSFHPDHARAIGVLPFGSPVPGKRVWLSRAKVSERRSRVLNEPELEALLIADGWSVLHPEDHNIRGQVAAMQGAETLAGFDGSAFHTLVLARDVGARQVIIPRGTVDRLTPTFQTISDAKNLEQIKLGLEMDHVAGDRRASTIVRLRSVEKSFETLRGVVARRAQAEPPAYTNSR